MDSLLEIDWGEAWRERYKLSKRIDDSTHWDERSKDFKEYASTSAYKDIFLAYLALEPGLSVFDMGSGSGTLAIPLAKAGHPVIAADFSAGMREVTRERAEAEGLENIEVIELDWNSDWALSGIKPKSVDVAIASRSTIVADLADALAKLERIARKKVAITLPTKFSPRGYKISRANNEEGDTYLSDYIFGINILFQMGVYPELRFIDTIHGNGGELEDKLVRWAYVSWEPLHE